MGRRKTEGTGLWQLPWLNYQPTHFHAGPSDLESSENKYVWKKLLVVVVWIVLECLSLQDLLLLVDPTYCRYLLCILGKQLNLTRLLLFEWPAAPLERLNSPPGDQTAK